MYKFGVVPNANPIRLGRPYLPVVREEYSTLPTVATMKTGGMTFTPKHKLPVVTVLKDLKI